ncbi:MAG: hypothetical protein WCR20_23775 [Verrucomicrobiota bacterium]
MKNKKLIIVGVIAMIAMGLYLYFAVKKSKTVTSTTATDPNSQTGSTATTGTTPTATNNTNTVQGAIALPVLPSWLNWLTGSSITPSLDQEQYLSGNVYNTAVFPLKFGSKGNEVLNLQKYLNNNVMVPFSKLKEDSNFGALTQSALLRTVGVMTVSESWYRTNILNLK